jgi:hypothetical protein
MVSDGSLVAMVARGDALGDDRLLIGDPSTGEGSVILRISRFDDHTLIASIAFAPTGKELLFCGVTLDHTATRRLYTNLTMVSDHPDCYADWSSTNRIVAASGVGDIKRMLRMFPDRSHRQFVTSPAGYDATWTPDGIGFAFFAPSRGFATAGPNSGSVCRMGGCASDPRGRLAATTSIR